MADDWEICRDRYWSDRDEDDDDDWAPAAYASLNRRGEIALNPEAFRRIKEPYNVALLWDAKRRRIGVKFPVTADKNFFAAQRYGRGRRMRIVRGGRLLKQFGIEIGRTLAFYDVPTETFRGEPMLVLELAKGVELGRES